MSFDPAGGPVNFNLAVESLKETLQHEQNAARSLNTLSAEPPPDTVLSTVGGHYGLDPERGFSIDTDV